MITVLTTLPIYNKIEKQCFQRSKHATNNGLFSIVCPRHRLPSFQWIDDSDGAASVSKIETIDSTGATTNITTYFISLPALAHDYFTYSGLMLNYLLPTGAQYLKITMNNGFIYYSEWFTVDCVYEMLVTDPEESGNLNYNVHNLGSGSYNIVNVSGFGSVLGSNKFSVRKGEVLTFMSFLTLNSGELPFIEINGGGIISNVEYLTAGFNIIQLTITTDYTNADLYIKNTTTTNFNLTEIYLIRQYSSKYLIIDFHNDCDLGYFYYHGGFTQTLWFESEPMEISFPQEEDGVKNGEGRFVRSFARQEKKYIARTKELPDYMVDVFNRMKLHDFIELTDLVGDTHYLYNLEVEHEWIDTDKYYAHLNLTFDFDEAIVIAGCCNDII